MIGQVGKDSRVIIIKEAVRVRVPVKSPDMEFCLAIRIRSGEVIPEHWHNAFSVGRVVVNRNFYGISEADLGKTIVGTVQLFEKTVRDRTYTNWDVFKAKEWIRSTCKLKILESENEGAFPIQGTSKFICFG